MISKFYSKQKSLGGGGLMTSYRGFWGASTLWGYIGGGGGVVWELCPSVITFTVVVFDIISNNVQRNYLKTPSLQSVFRFTDIVNKIHND